MSPYWDVAGTATDEPMAEAFKVHARTRKPVLVCVRKMTDFGNPYVVPATTIDDIKRIKGGFLVTSDGIEYRVNARGGAIQA